MNVTKEPRTKKLKTIPMAPDEGINSNFTAIPHDQSLSDPGSLDSDLVEAGLEYGEMNESDARESGYISPLGTEAPSQKAESVNPQEDVPVIRSDRTGSLIAAAGAALLIGVGYLLLRQKHD